MAASTAITVQRRPEHPAGACACGNTGVVFDDGKPELCICNLTTDARRRHAFRLFGVIRLGRGRLGLRGVDEISAAPKTSRDDVLARMENVARFFEFDGLDELLEVRGEKLDGFDEIAVRSWTETVGALRGDAGAGKAVA